MICLYWQNSKFRTSSREQSLSVLLVFLQDFDKCVKESIGQLEHIEKTYAAIFSNKTDITQGVTALKVSPDLFYL